MLFKNISILDETFNVKKGMNVLVQGEKITYIGESLPEGTFADTYDGTGKLLMSAFVNTHSHAAMTLLRGYAENLPLSRWLNEKVFPFEARLNENDVYNGTMLAAAEMLRFGTSSFSDMYMLGEGMARAAVDSKMKANLCLSTVCFDDRHYSDLPVFKESRALFENYHNSYGGKIKIDYCIHAEYTSKEKLVREIAEYVKGIGARIQLHLSETKDEHEACIKRHGLTPAGYFARAGVFASPVTAAHCVWVDDNDLDILKHYGVYVAANPASNLKLASGFAPVPAMLSKGVNVTIGTDGAASNNNLNMWKDLYLFSVAYKASSGDASAVTPRDALRCAALNGALSQGREDCGLLKAGKRADLLVLDLDVPNMYPAVSDGVNALCYSAQGGDVILTMVDGEILYKNGEYFSLDIEKVKHDAQKSAERILSEL